MKKEKNYGRKAALAAALAALTIGGTAAFFTDYDSVMNEFTLGKVDIELEEPSWNPEENKEIVPEQHIKKDPQIKNIGINDSFVYLRIRIPTAEVITADDAGNRLPKRKQELAVFSPKASWSLLETRSADSYQEYTYGFNSVLKPGSKTEALFDEISFINIVEGQLDTQSFSIPIDAYAIQSENTGGAAADVKGQMKEAYQKYVNQNKEQGSGV